MAAHPTATLQVFSNILSSACHGDRYILTAWFSILISTTSRPEAQADIDVRDLRLGGRFSTSRQRLRHLKPYRKIQLAFRHKSLNHPRSCWKNADQRTACCEVLVSARTSWFAFACPDLAMCCNPNYLFDGDVSSGLRGFYHNFIPYRVPFLEIATRELALARQRSVTASDRQLYRSQGRTQKKLAAVLVAGQIRSMMTTLEISDFNITRRDVTLRKLRALGHPSPRSESVAANIQRYVYRGMLAEAMGGSVGFDVFMYVETLETEGEPAANDTSVCEPLRPKGCPTCQLLCRVEKELAAPPKGAEGFSKVASLGKTHANRMLSILHQLDSLKRVNDLRQAYARAYNVEYEWILRVRPDVYFLVPLPPVDALRDLTRPWSQPVFVSARPPVANEDHFMVGQARIMDLVFRASRGLNNSAMEQRLVNTWILQQFTTSEGRWEHIFVNQWNLEEYLAHWLDMHGSFLVSHPEIRPVKCRRVRGKMQDEISRP